MTKRVLYLTTDFTDFTELVGYQAFQGFFVEAGNRNMETYSVDYHN